MRISLAPLTARPAAFSVIGLAFAVVSVCSEKVASGVVVPVAVVQTNPFAAGPEPEALGKAGHAHGIMAPLFCPNSSWLLAIRSRTSRTSPIAAMDLRRNRIIESLIMFSY